MGTYIFWHLEKLNNINSVKTAIGGAAGTVAALEEIPLIGAIKTYDIYVDYSVER